VRTFCRFAFGAMFREIASAKRLALLFIFFVRHHLRLALLAASLRADRVVCSPSASAFLPAKLLRRPARRADAQSAYASRVNNFRGILLFSSSRKMKSVYKKMSTLLNFVFARRMSIWATPNVSRTCAIMRHRSRAKFY